MPQINFEDTIAAISTPIGEGGIGIVRLSGPKAIEFVDQIFRSKSGQKLINTKPLRVIYGHIIDEKGNRIDEALVTLFKSPKSYTCEDLVEISSHGGIRVTRKILDLILKQGVRSAEPGEFTKRAFLNGRLDLAQAEAVLDVIRAKTDASLVIAQDQLQGHFSREIRKLRDDLMKVYAHIEAFVDFPEEDIEVFSHDEVLKRLEEIIKHVRNLILTYQKGEVMREGILTVIVGRPNVGKSSLLNALLVRDRAIVSEFPGTTRDALEEMIELDGILFRIVDTAGLGPHKDHLDQLSMERTKKYLEQGQIFLHVLDGSSPMTEEDRNIADLVAGKKVITVINKVDLLPTLTPTPLPFKGRGKGEGCIVRISAKTRSGLSDLERSLAGIVWNGSVHVDGVTVTRLRHKVALERALESLESAKKVFLNKESLEFLSFDIKTALDALAELIGEVYSEDLLDVIFSEFCIGK